MNNLTLGILISMAAWYTPAPTYSYGGATWYAPGVMEATCAYRDLSLTGFLDGVAMMSPADLGKTVWVSRGDGWEGPFLVCDCGVRGQVWEMVMVRGEVIEMGWRTAHRWGLGPFDGGWKIPVAVAVADLPPVGKWAPIDYMDWFAHSLNTSLIANQDQDQIQDR